MRAAVSNEGVLAATTLHEQIGLLCDILRPYGEGISYAKIGKIFSPPKSHATVKRHFEAWKKQPKEPKRPELLSQEQYNTLRSKISETIRYSGNPSLTNIIDFINESFGISVSRATATRILNRIGFRLMKARPMEEERCSCKLEDIIGYYRNLSRILAEIPCGFCFNLDESGIQRYVDAKDTYLVVQDDFPDKELTFPVYRASKRITLLHCISTDGSYTKPLEQT